MISFTRKQNIKYLLAITFITVTAFAAAKFYEHGVTKTEINRNMFTDHTSKSVFDTLKTAKGNQNISLIDFRTPGEYNEGHIEGAVWISYFDPAYKEKLSALDKNKTYFIYDRSGRITPKIIEKMKDLGFKEVHKIQGGIDAWKNQGLPLNFQN